MARIRSIKPEFWKDGRVNRLSESCALFFIGLWNFCDDEGKCHNDSLELALNMPRFHSKHVSRWIKTLFEVGLIQLSTDFRWILITNWNHQKIDKPRLPSLRKSEIEWLPVNAPDLSTNARRLFDDTSTNVRRKDRIGEDRIGEDRIGLPPGVNPVADSDAKAVVKSIAKEKREPLTGKTWEAYSKAYEARYKTEPVRNLTVNSQLTQLVKRLGEDAAPEVAAFYLSHSDQFYVRNLHPVGLMLRDAEKLHTEWKTKRRMTSQEARGAEQGDYHRSQLDRIAKGEL